MKRGDALRMVLDFSREHGPEEVRAAALLLEPKGKAKAVAGSERGLAFADWFRSTLAEGVRLSKDWRERWARCFDEMLKLDGRTPEQVAAVCRWARRDDFWKVNFQTPLKLRQRKDGVMYFDRFVEAMRAGRVPGVRKGQSRGYEIAPEQRPAIRSAVDLLREGSA